MSGASSEPPERDAHGFPVHPSCAALHRQFAPIWAEEEAERRERWAQWLAAYRDFEGVSGSELSDAQLMARALDQYAAGGGGDGGGPHATLLQQLRALVQMGVPALLRPVFWPVFLDVGAKRVEGEYGRLLARATALTRQRLDATEVPDPGSDLPRPPTDVFCVAVVDSSSDDEGAAAAEDWLAQIDKDLHRTFPDHPRMGGPGRAALRRLLAAYAVRNPAVGYCQGENFLAAAFLLFFPEEEAFWCLAAAVEDLLPGYFDARMVAPQVDARAFGHLLRGAAPRLAAHLDALQVDIPSATSAWFLVAFLNTLPPEAWLRVWDLLFFERSAVVLFRVALALVDVYAQALLETEDSSEAYLALQAMGPMSHDASRLVDAAAIGYGHVKDAALRVLRDKYRPGVVRAMEGLFSCDEEMQACYEAAAAEAEAAPLSRSQSFAEALAASGAFLGLFHSEPGSPGGEGAATPPPPPLLAAAMQRRLSPSPRSPQARGIVAAGGRRGRDSPGRSPSPSPLGLLREAPAEQAQQPRSAGADPWPSSPTQPFARFACRRTRSDVPAGALRRSSTHQALQRRMDLYSTFVPDITNPKVQSLLRIATATKKKGGAPPRSPSQAALDALAPPTALLMALKKGSAAEGGAGDEGATIDIGSLAGLIKALKYGQTTEISSVSGSGSHSMLRVPRRFTDGGALLRAGLPAAAAAAVAAALPPSPAAQAAAEPDSPGTNDQKLVKLQRLRDGLAAEVEGAGRQREAAVATAAEATHTAEALHRQLSKIQKEIDEKVSSILLPFRSGSPHAFLSSLAQMAGLHGLYGRIAAADAALAATNAEVEIQDAAVTAAAAHLTQLRAQAEASAAAAAALMSAVAGARASPPTSPTRGKPPRR